jgi:hypothetical protein
MQRSHDILEDCPLGLISGVDAERKFLLTGILRTEGNRRKHHASYSVTLESQLRSTHRDILGQDAVRHVRKMEIMRLSCSPREDSNLIIKPFNCSIAGA